MLTQKQRIKDTFELRQHSLMQKPADNKMSYYELTKESVTFMYNSCLNTPLLKAQSHASLNCFLVAQSHSYAAINVIDTQLFIHLFILTKFNIMITMLNVQSKVDSSSAKEPRLFLHCRTAWYLKMSPIMLLSEITVPMLRGICKKC